SCFMLKLLWPYADVDRHNMAWILPKTTFFGGMTTLTSVKSDHSSALKDGRGRMPPPRGKN
ncbi:hypothetical protein, partial [uncultured Bilophila sp.]|uniref:hypothetical protein n=1 Tax=uncultured Bilophila sp. TaxID=529385 RepID=UPI002602CE25